MHGMQSPRPRTWRKCANCRATVPPDSPASSAPTRRRISFSSSPRGVRKISRYDSRSGLPVPAVFRREAGRQVMARTFVLSVAILVFGSAAHRPQLIGKTDHEPHTDVFALFDLAAPESGPFPSDIFSVEDATEITGRRLAHPYSDCALRPSDCNDLDIVNTLDGWGLQTRISVPFSGDIDLRPITSDSVFVVSLGSTVPGNPPGGQRIGINQVVWDVATHTLHFEVDRLLDEHRRYGVIVTREVLDSRGKHVRKTEGFENRAITVPSWYATQIDEALAGAHAFGVPPGHVVTASVFTTQTITSVMERIRDHIKAGTPAPAD